MYYFNMDMKNWSLFTQSDDNLFFVLMDRAQELLLVANVPRGTTGLSKIVNK